ncbi:PREDICTED: gephyrin [Ceratosolen solmsi marchali]|uniref:Gephyrin n=1 Tax=Ceratosolen solmsi marchali TaxID=326594 RepID=A0AAJ6YVR9_9HYME|nr:PREDICTED: gephyrin [Ceratosolen solmsi marchali]
MCLITVGILTISDSCFKHKAKDVSGSILKNIVNNQESKNDNVQEFQIQCSDIVPDNEFIIMEILTRWSDTEKINVILTTGGTGFSSHDVTPEATKKIIQKEAPGIVYAMISECLKITPMAILSRAVCGIRNQTLIINLPGSPKAVKECFNAIANIIPHAVDLILDNKKSVVMTHSNQDDTHNNYLCKNSKNPLNLYKIAHRDRKSPFPLISLEESQDILRNTVEKQIPSVTIDLGSSFGRVLAETVYSPIDVPSFNASIKDGYAVIAQDGKGKRTVICGLVAGHNLRSVKILPGTCARINTGAVVPDDATAIVQVEDTKLLQAAVDDIEEKEIEILIEPTDGLNIRSIGSDIKRNSAVLMAGTKMGAVEIGILASCGCNRIFVTPNPEIGILSTGSELQDVGEILRPGYIYDSNRITLRMMLQAKGFNPIDFGIVSDEESLMVDRIGRVLKKVDVLITTGSVSMGDKDILKRVLKEALNATIHFGRVNLKPGMPTTYATCNYFGKKKYMLCLPGNPVSAMVAVNLFVFPLLNYLTNNNERLTIVKAMLTSKYILDSRQEFARVILRWTDNQIYPQAYSTGSQCSSKLLSCRNANALLILPQKSSSIQELDKGTLVDAMLLEFNYNVNNI